MLLNKLDLTIMEYNRAAKLPPGRREKRLNRLKSAIDELTGRLATLEAQGIRPRR
jgi:hypothetical protein